MNIEDYLDLKFDDYDCYDLAALIYKKELDINLPTFSYSLDSKNTVARSIVDGKKIFNKIEKPEPYAIVLMKTGQYKRHIGVMIDSRKFIHMVRGYSPVVSSIRDNEYVDNILGFFTYGDSTGRD